MRRNDEDLTGAAARELSTMSRVFRTWGVEKRLREQLADAGLVVAEQHGREWALALTPAGRDLRRVYRRARMHRTPAVVRAPFPRDDRAVVLSNAAACAGAIAVVCAPAPAPCTPAGC